MGKNLYVDIVKEENNYFIKIFDRQNVGVKSFQVIRIAGYFMKALVA